MTSRGKCDGACQRPVAGRRHGFDGATKRASAIVDSEQDSSACSVPRVAAVPAGGGHAHLETRMAPRADATAEEFEIRFAQNVNGFNGK